MKWGNITFQDYVRTLYWENLKAKADGSIVMVDETWIYKDHPKQNRKKLVFGLMVHVFKDEELHKC